MEWCFNLLLWKGQQLVFNGYRMVTHSPGPAAVTSMPQHSQHLVSSTHQCSRRLPPSLPVDGPPPAAGTVPALWGTNVLWLLGDRTGQTPDFKETKERRPGACCPYSSTHLPSLPGTDLPNQGHRRMGFFRLWSRCLCPLFPTSPYKVSKGLAPTRCWYCWLKLNESLSFTAFRSPSLFGL